MGKLIQRARFRRVEALPAFEARVDDGARSIELWPIGLLLFVASVARVVHAAWRREPFGPEPTFALLFVVGLPWLAFRSRWKQR